MNLKYFENIDGVWLDVSGQTGASLEYNEVSGWVTSGGYKKYIAQITQSETEPPTAVILENTLGFVPTWQYSKEGTYGFNFVDYDFNSDKCIFYLGCNFSGDGFIWIEYNQEYEITLKSSKGDGKIIQTTLEIRYYN